MDVPIGWLVTSVTGNDPPGSHPSTQESHRITRPGRFPSVFEAQVAAGGQKLGPGNGHRVVGAQTQAPST